MSPDPAIPPETPMVAQTRMSSPAENARNRVHRLTPAFSPSTITITATIDTGGKWFPIRSVFPR